jgi:O-methyltransferase involved in polyketide biosynthesis
MQYLRKQGTNQIFTRTAALSERDDMIAVTEEEVAKIEKQRQAEIAQHFRIVKEQEENPQPILTQKEEASIESMDEAELKAKASELKIAIKDGTPVSTLRNMVKKTLELDAKDPTSQKPKRKAQAPAVLKAPETMEEAKASPANAAKKE